MPESIERLREYVRDNEILMDLESKIDAIEREVEEGCMELPKDADGETIRLGDVIECSGKKLKVMGLSKTQAFCFDKGKIVNLGAKIVRHHKPPTVESVLEEFADERIKLFFRMPMATTDEGIQEYCKENDTACEKLIAEYAAKLQIKEISDGRDA